MGQQGQIKKELVLVTGSSGLIGAEVCKRLEEKYLVVGLDLKPPRRSGKTNFNCQKMDISSQQSIDRALENIKNQYGQKIASVIHLAAYYSFSDQDRTKYDLITVRGTEKLIHTLKRLFTLEQFVFSSTMLVHAPSEDQEITERSKVVRSWPYPNSKIETEKILNRECANIPLVKLRIAGVYDDGCHSIPIANQIQRIYEKQLTSVLFPGDTSKGQAFVHMEDLIDAIRRVVERRNRLPPNTVLLIGEPETLSYDQIQDAIGQALYGVNWPTIPVPETVAKIGAWAQDKVPFGRESFIKPWMIEFADQHYDLDVTRAFELLEWKPKHKLSDSIPKMIEALKADPDRWYREQKLSAPHGALKLLGELRSWKGVGLLGLFLAVASYRIVKLRQTSRETG
jgi:nucleoside-diphosphate-sugar epimerase